MTDPQSWSFETRQIHAGTSPDPTTGAVMQPVYLTSTYRQPALDGEWPYDYARTINPTRRALERQLAELEGGVDARCFASGMSAITAVAHLLRSGDHVVVSQNVYGRTYRLFEGLLRQFVLDLGEIGLGCVLLAVGGELDVRRFLLAAGEEQHRAQCGQHRDGSTWLRSGC